MPHKGNRHLSNQSKRNHTKSTPRFPQQSKVTPDYDLARLQRAVLDPATATPHDIQALQRTYGNQAVSALLQSSPIQAQSIVGPAKDRYEREADQVAHQVLSMPPSPTEKSPKKMGVQRASKKESRSPKPVKDQIKHETTSTPSDQPIQRLITENALLQLGGDPEQDPVFSHIVDAVGEYHEARAEGASVITLESYLRVIIGFCDQWLDEKPETLDANQARNAKLIPSIKTSAQRELAKVEQVPKKPEGSPEKKEDTFSKQKRLTKPSQTPQAIMDALTRVRETAQPLAAMLVKFIIKVTGLGKLLKDTVMDFIAGIDKKAVLETVMNLGGNIIGLLRQIADSIIGALPLDQLMQAYDFIKAIIDPLKDVLGPVIGIFDAVGGSFITLIPNVIQFGMSARDTIKRFKNVRALKKAKSATTSKLREAAAYAYRKVLRSFITKIYNSVDALGKVLTGVGNIAIDIAALFTEGFSEGAKPVTMGISLGQSLIKLGVVSARGLKGLWKIFKGTRGKNRKKYATEIVKAAEAGDDQALTLITKMGVYKTFASTLGYLTTATTSLLTDELLKLGKKPSQSQVQAMIEQFKAWGQTNIEAFIDWIKRNIFDLPKKSIGAIIKALFSIIFQKHADSKEDLKAALQKFKKFPQWRKALISALTEKFKSM